MSERKTYAEILKDPRWQKRRLKVLEYAHWRCQICGAKDRTLHCHHSYYTKGKKPWQYPDGAIISVCEDCHEMLHPKPAPEPAPKLEIIATNIPISNEKAADKFKEIFESLAHIK